MSDYQQTPPPRPRARSEGLAAWQKRNTIAQWISAVVAAGALIGFFVQLNAVKVTTREGTARQLYGNYMDAGLRYPEFLVPDYASIKSDRKQLAQYRWFVLYMLFVYDEIFHAVGAEGWAQAFRTELRPHLPVLCDMEKQGFLSQYYPRTAEIVRAEMRAARTSVPECANLTL